MSFCILRLFLTYIRYLKTVYDIALSRCNDLFVLDNVREASVRCSRNNLYLNILRRVAVIALTLTPVAVAPVVDICVLNSNYILCCTRKNKRLYIVVILTCVVSSCSEIDVIISCKIGRCVKFKSDLVFCLVVLEGSKRLAVAARDIIGDTVEYGVVVCIVLALLECCKILARCTEYTDIDLIVCPESVRCRCSITSVKAELMEACKSCHSR